MGAKVEVAVLAGGCGEEICYELNVQPRSACLQHPGSSLGEGLVGTLAPGSHGEACGNPCFPARGCQQNGVPGSWGETSLCSRKPAVFSFGFGTACEREASRRLGTQEGVGPLLPAPSDETAGPHGTAPRGLSTCPWTLPGCLPFPAWFSGVSPTRASVNPLSPQSARVVSEARTSRTTVGIITSLVLLMCKWV